VVSGVSLFASFSLMALSGFLNLIPVLAAMGRFPLPRIALNLCSCVLGWMALITLEMLVLGMLGWLRPWAIVGVSIALACITIGFSGGSFVTGLGVLKCAWKAIRHGAKASPVLAFLLVICAGLLLIRELIHIWFLPPYVYDVLVYHLPRVADWVREGQFVMVSSPILRVWWPANFELLQTWVAVFFHHDALIELPGLAAYALSIAGVFALFRIGRLGQIKATWLTLAYAVTPCIVMQAVSCKNDLAVAAVFIFVMVLWLEADCNVESDPARIFWSIIALAWGLGVKPYLLVISVGFVPLFILIAYRRYRSNMAIFHLVRSRNEMFWLSSAVLAAILLGGFWYFRNIAYWGNPLYPVAMKIGHWRLPGVEGVYQQGALSMHSLTQTLRELAESKIWDKGQPFNPELGNLAGWGWFIVVVGIPLSLLAIFRDLWFRKVAVVFSISFLFLYSSVNSDPWNMRFALWVPVLFTLGCGVGLRCMHNRDIRRAFVLLAVAMSLLNYVGTINNGYYRRDEWRAQISRSLAERSPFTGWDEQLARLPADAVVAYRMGDNDPLYLLHGPFMRRRPVYLPSIEGSNDLFRQMKNAGAEWLFILTPHSTEDAAIKDLIRMGVLCEIWPGLYRRNMDLTSMRR
jgi:hypothetical protein